MADIPSTPADGNLKLVVVPTIANPDAPTATELAGGTVVDISCYLTGDGFAPGMDEGTISDPRLCDRQTYEQPGRVTRSLSVTYIVNPGSSTDNAAYDVLEPGSTGYIVERRGTDYEAALAADDTVWVWPFKAGQYNHLPPEANSVLRVTQKLFVTGAVRQDVAVVAGA